eukprot:COSAG05_NODE_2911_length_2516_cov_2.661150_1_plen_128_part_00
MCNLGFIVIVLRHTSHDRVQHKGGVSERISQYRETGLYDLSETLGIQISPPVQRVGCWILDFAGHVVGSLSGSLNCRLLIFDLDVRVFLISILGKYIMHCAAFMMYVPVNVFIVLKTVHTRSTALYR